jgi:methyltransferase family protein
VRHAVAEPFELVSDTGVEVALEALDRGEQEPHDLVRLLILLDGMWRRLLDRFRLPPDTWERHALVAELAGTAATVLDVGGVPSRLSAFLPQSSVTAVNVEPPADVLFDGVTLPFEAGSFDVVASVDVLEHLETDRRLAHARELARVARSRVVVCCPLGTPEHERSEAEMAAWHRSALGGPHRFLEEHVRLGLPREEELRALAAELPGRSQLTFHGDFRRAAELFKLGVLTRRRRRPRVAAAYVRRRFLSRMDRTLRPEAAPTTNRAFLVIDLA